jgi:hypothetical protein
MSWSRSEPDPIKSRRRQLAEQERQLAERMAKLNQQLQDGPATAAVKKAVEPPVWRMEDEASKPATPDIAPTGHRVLARQRRRDKVIFFLCIAFLVVLLIIVACVWSSMRGGMSN